MEKAGLEGDRISWSKADSEFHEIIMEACLSILLAQTGAQMHNCTHHLTNIDSQTSPSSQAESTIEHQEIVNMMSTCDADGAEIAARQPGGKLG